MRLLLCILFFSFMGPNLYGRCTDFDSSVSFKELTEKYLTTDYLSRAQVHPDFSTFEENMTRSLTKNIKDRNSFLDNIFSTKRFAFHGEKLEVKYDIMFSNSPSKTKITIEVAHIGSKGTKFLEPSQSIDSTFLSFFIANLSSFQKLKNEVDKTLLVNFKLSTGNRNLAKFLANKAGFSEKTRYVLYDEQEIIVFENISEL
jgi:hypothetical protein